MNSQEALKSLCKNCQEQMSQIPTQEHEDSIEIHSCGHQMCPFRTISNDYCEEYDTLKELVDKDTPKKVVETFYDLQESDLDNEFHCPSCKETIMDREQLEDGYMKIPYCYYCGQKLDWSDYE